MNGSQQVLLIAHLYGIPDEILLDITLTIDSVEERNNYIMEACLYYFCCLKYEEETGIAPDSLSIEEVEKIVDTTRNSLRYEFAIETLRRFKDYKKKKLH